MTKDTRASAIKKGVAPIQNRRPGHQERKRLSKDFRSGAIEATGAFTGSTSTWGTKSLPDSTGGGEERQSESTLQAAGLDWRVPGSGARPTSGARTVLLIGGSVGTWSRWRHFAQATLAPPWKSGTSRTVSQRGQAKRIIRDFSVTYRDTGDPE